MLTTGLFYCVSAAGTCLKHSENTRIPECQSRAEVFMGAGRHVGSGTSRGLSCRGLGYGRCGIPATATSTQPQATATATATSTQPQATATATATSRSRGHRLGENWIEKSFMQKLEDQCTFLVCCVNLSCSSELTYCDARSSVLSIKGSAIK